MMTLLRSSPPLPLPAHPPSPAAPPPLLPLSPASVARRINLRFRCGKPSNDLREAGVLMRAFEGMAGRHTAAWEPCAADEFCSRARDRLAASIVNPRMTHLFSYEAGGVVLNPSLASVLCSYHGDGNNFGRFCLPPTGWLKMPSGIEQDGSPCVPGCTSRFGWCDDIFRPCPLCEQVHCAWRSNGLASMVSAHQDKLVTWGDQGHRCEKDRRRSSCHNEVVLNATAWMAHMPATIEAFFIQATSSTKAVAETRSIYKQFRRTFQGSGDGVPLLVYDRNDLVTPFSVSVSRL